MDVVLTKKQLNLLKELATGGDSNGLLQGNDTIQTNSTQNRPAINVSNQKGNHNTSTLETDIKTASQAPGASNFDKTLDVPTYVSGQVSKDNANKELKLPVTNGNNVTTTSNMVRDYLKQTPANKLPGKIRLVPPNGAINSSREIKGKLVEVTTFKKTELDKFLKSL